MKNRLGFPLILLAKTQGPNTALSTRPVSASIPNANHHHQKINLEKQRRHIHGITHHQFMDGKHYFVDAF